MTVEKNVPAVSGVYGLHTERQQLFVGAAADLRAALLLHWAEVGNSFLGRQPTHFSFEECGADSRAERAQQLIAKHRPTIQALQVLSQAPLLSAAPQGEPAVHDSAADSETAAPPQWPPAAATGDANPKRSGYFSLSQVAALAALFLMTSGALAYLGIVTGQKIVARRTAALELAAARQPAGADSGAEPAPAAPSASIAADAKLDPATPAAANRKPAPPIQVASAPSPDGDAGATPAKRGVALKPAKVLPPNAAEDKTPIAPAVGQEPSSKSWSVQIASTQDEKAAQRMLGKLKNQGYDAFIVEADVNSARWYRVRVGRFGAKQEAEAARQALQSQENIRSAFVIAR